MEIPGPLIDIRIEPPKYANLIRAARTEVECDVIFGFLFELCQKEQTARNLLQWLYQADVCRDVQIELLISTLRLTYAVRDRFLINWQMLLEAVEFEVVGRGLDTETLLHGLQP